MSKESLAAVKAVAAGEELWTREVLRQVSGPLSSNGDADVRLTKREGEVLKQLAFGLAKKI